VPSSSIEHHLAVRDGAGRRLHEESLVPEHLLLEGDLLGDLLGAADDECAVQPGEGVELVADHGDEAGSLRIRPAARPGTVLARGFEPRHSPHEERPWSVR
jgi:hypothetical protein